MKSFFIKNAANFLTGLRLICVPILIVFFVRSMEVVSVLNLSLVYGCIAIICVSDLLDGRVARHLKVASKFGANFDVVTDMIYTISVTVFLCIKGLFPLILLLFFFEKTVNFFVTSALYQRKINNRFAYIKDPVGKIVSASYFFIPLVAYTGFVFLGDYYYLTYVVFVVQALAGIASSIYRIRMVHLA